MSRYLDIQITAKYSSPQFYIPHKLGDPQKEYVKPQVLATEILRRRKALEDLIGD